MKVKSRLCVVAALLASAAFLTGMASPFDIFKGSFKMVEDNKPKASIVVPADSPAKLASAVGEFNETHKAAFKTELPVVRARPAEGNAVVFELRKGDVKNDDDFEISFPDDTTMKISCTELSAAWALRHLLENHAGARWVMPKETGCGLAFTGLPGWDVPRKTIRDTGGFKFQRMMYLSPGDWQKKNRAKNAIRNDHGLIDAAFPAKEYEKNNSWPEGILPVVNGKKQIPRANAPGAYENYRCFWQPCFTNPESVREAVKNICAHFESNPNAHDVSLGVNDNGGYCECESCKKLVRPSKYSNMPSHSAAYYGWCNRVVEEVAKKFPDRYLGCMAYRETMDPPDFKLHPNLVPNLTIDIYAATDPEVKKNRMDAIRAWGEKAAQTTFFEYADPYCLPRIFFPLQEEMFKFMAENKVGGMFVEDVPTFGEGPKQYLYMRQMWNPDVDAEKVVSEWCADAVGEKAAAPLKEYYDFWGKFWREEVPKTAWFRNSKNNVYMTFGFGGYIYALKEGDMAGCRRLMERVVSLAETPEQKRRAEILMLHFELYEANAIASVAELIPVGQQAESEDQAEAILKAVPKACEYLKRRDSIVEKIRAAYPYLNDAKFKWIGDGLDYKKDPFTSGIITAVTPFLKSPKVAAELEKLAANQDVPSSLCGQAVVFQKLGSDRASLKNLVRNGSFEEPGIPWANNYGAVQTDKAAFDGKRSCELVMKGPRGNVHSFFPVEADADYMFLARVYVPKDQVSVEAYVEMAAFLWQDKTPLQWYIPPQIKLAPGEWTLIKAFVPRHAKATRVETWIAFNKFENGDKVYVDDVMLVKIDK